MPVTSTTSAAHWQALETSIRNQTSESYYLFVDYCCTPANIVSSLNLLNNVFGTNYEQGSFENNGLTATLNPNSNYASVLNAVAPTMTFLQQSNIVNVADEDVLYYSPNNPTEAVALLKELPNATCANNYVYFSTDASIFDAVNSLGGSAVPYTNSENIGKLRGTLNAVNQECAPSFENCDVDTDGDGIVNSLDLDSYNDLCPHYREGEHTFTPDDVLFA